MKTLPYALVVGSLTYAQTCTRPNISLVVSWQDIKVILDWITGKLPRKSYGT